MTYALDTNCLVRWLLWDNEAQAKRVDTALQSAKNSVHVADLAIIEAAWVLKSVYEFSDETIGKFITAIIEHKNINCNKVLFRKVAAEITGVPKVNLTDICLAHYALLSGADTLLTFDKTLVRCFPQLTELG